MKNQVYALANSSKMIGMNALTIIV